MLEKWLAQKADKKERNARLTAYEGKLDRMINENAKKAAGDSAEKSESRK